MTDADFDAADLDVLLSALCDSRLTQRQLDQLNGLLRSDPDLRRRYRFYMGLHLALRHEIPASRSARDEAISDWRSPSETPGDCPLGGRGRDSSSFRFRSIGLVASLLVSFVAGTGTLVWWWPRRDSPAAFSNSAPIVARVSGTAGARFEGYGLSAGLKDPLRAGTYRLAEGIVQVTFARGAEVMIAAPAEFVAPGRGPDVLEARQTHGQGYGTSQRFHRRDAARDTCRPGDGIRGGRGPRRQWRGSCLPRRGHRPAQVADRFASPAADQRSGDADRFRLGDSSGNRSRFQPVSPPT